MQQTVPPNETISTLGEEDFGSQSWIWMEQETFQAWPLNHLKVTSRVSWIIIFLNDSNLFKFVLNNFLSIFNYLNFLILFYSAANSVPPLDG